MPELNVVKVEPHGDGWLVSGDDAPIGFIADDASVTTPSGAIYTVSVVGEGYALRSADGHAAVTLGGGILKDEVRGVEWTVRAGWAAGATDGTLYLNDVWAMDYTMEDAQDTVPNRVRLLLAWIITR